MSVSGLQMLMDSEEGDVLVSGCGFRAEEWIVFPTWSQWGGRLFLHECIVQECRVGSPDMAHSCKSHMITPSPPSLRSGTGLDRADIIVLALATLLRLQEVLSLTQLPVI